MRKKTDLLIKNECMKRIRDSPFEVFHPNHVRMWNLLRIFAWMATWSKVLGGRRWPINANFLIFCDVAGVMWHLLFSLLGMSLVLPSTLKGFLLVGVGHLWEEKKGLRGAASLYLFWMIYRERNSRAFNKENSVHRIKLHFLV